MRYALIDPQQEVNDIPNFARVAQVEDHTFPVAEPLRWIECADNIVADQWYFDTELQLIKRIPVKEQPVAQGVQTL